MKYAFFFLLGAFLYTVYSWFETIQLLEDANKRNANMVKSMLSTMEEIELCYMEIAVLKDEKCAGGDE